MAENKRSILAVGTPVMTTGPNEALRREWTDAAWKKRKWNTTGTIASYSDSHGLCYKVKHEDGQEAWYDPSEFVVVSPKKCKK